MRLRFEINIQRNYDEYPMREIHHIICNDYFSGLKYVKDNYLSIWEGYGYKYITIICYDYENVLVGAEILA